MGAQATQDSGKRFSLISGRGLYGREFNDFIDRLTAALARESATKRTNDELAPTGARLANVQKLADDLVRKNDEGRLITNVVRRQQILRDLLGMRPEEGDVREVIPELITALNDPDSTVAANSARALGRLGTDAAVAVTSLTLHFVQHESVDVKIAVAAALGEIGPLAAEAVRALINAMNETDSRALKGTAIVALGLIGPLAAEGIPALRTIAAETDDSPVRAAAIMALIQIAPNRKEVVQTLSSGQCCPG